jgi:CRISPR-associated protein Cmr2
MTEAHLLLVALGPVQDFIAQARRSRDLWFGSHLLSELSRAAAARLATAGARLIFPALAACDPELAPCDAPTRPDGAPPISIANKILAEVPAEIDPHGCAESVRQAVRERWLAIAQSVRNGRGRCVLAAGSDAVWDEQVADILEFYAVWVPLAGAYKDVRQAAEQALAGRKSLRDFCPWRHDRAGAPKSSLDGARVSVLASDRRGAGFRRLRIAEGEQLDAIGLIKRAGFEPEQFVPIVNVAAGAWLRLAAAKAPAELAALREACRAQGIAQIWRSLPVVGPLPFDAGVLYPSRWPALFKELVPPQENAAVARRWGEAHVRPLLRRMSGEPPAYVACLAADGDHMGRAIDGLCSAAANRQFSQALARFPGEARDIVEQRHCGSLIYAGGDDVLAFLPVATAPECAAALARAFADRLGQAAPAGAAPTLSVGIAVGHVLEPMSLLLDLARRAERMAKDAGRAALAIIVSKRSGGERRLALPWARDPLQRLRKDAALLDKKALSTGKVHELEALLRRFPDPAQVAAEPQAVRALAGYAADILAHADEGAAASLSDLGVERQSDYARLRASLAAAIDRVLVVRALREAGF